MATKRLPFDQLQSRTRRFNDGLRVVISCPLCAEKLPSTVDVVKWRASGVRLSCRKCGLRFTLDRNTLGAALKVDIDVPGSWPRLAHLIFAPETVE